MAAQPARTGEPAPSPADLLRAYDGADVLVTGGLGFIGSNLARRLVTLGARVTLMDSMIPDYGGNPFNIHDIRDRVTVNFADVRQRSTMDFLVQGRDYLFNLAGQVSHIDSMRDPFTDLDINCRSQLSILEACRHNNTGVRVVFAGSRQVYGRPQYLPVDEAHPVRPVDVNGVNKVAGESYHVMYHDVYGIRACSLRLTNTYGPGQLVKHDRQGFIGWFIRTVVEGGQIQLYGDGSQQRDLNFVDDVVEAFLLAGVSERAAGQIYNLAAEPPVALADLARLLVELSGRGSVRTVPWPEDKRRIDIGSYYGTHARISAELGWTPRTPLQDGLRRTLDYYAAHLKHYL
ncbi:MAG TPA: NAD-dependent epimerase/dehydratase family protein [Planctomycetota bacterium]|nr:NAD-dependent epimerase/dehydratase family protein [Planctomycetota bacterium]